MRILAVSILGALALFIAVVLGPSIVPYDANNPYWDGYSTFASLCGARVIYSLDELGNATLLFVTTPSDLDVDLLRSFLLGGGRLVLLSNGSSGNVILEGLGVRSRFAGVMIRDPVLNGINEEFPLALVVGNVSEVLILGGASPIDVRDPGASVIATTSYFSVAGNSTGPFPVIIGVPYGGGYVILVSTPTVFMNSMVTRYDNEEFLLRLCGNSTVAYLEPISPSPVITLRMRLLLLYRALEAYPLNEVLVLAPLLITLALRVARGNH